VSVLPVRALAYDGDAEFIVARAPSPPVTAAARFRAESAPVAARLAEQVRVARDLLAGAALDAGARAAVGRGLHAVVVELRELAESYDIAAVADVCRAREASAATLDPRAVAGVEHVAHGLLGALAPARAPTPPAPTPAPPPPPEPPVAPASEPPADSAFELAPEPAAEAAAPAPAAPFRPPTGPALVELLEHSITGIERWPGTPLDMPAVPPPPAAAAKAFPPDGVVPVEVLLYRGKAALARARAVRDQLRARDGAPDPALLAELYDLIDLAAAD
jgi:hypothetical protein